MSVQVTGLQCEYRQAWLGSDVASPRFSWKLRTERRGAVQTAFRLQVFQIDLGREALGPHDRLLWDSGTVESDESIHVEYRGPELESCSRYLARVKVRDNHGGESDWSSPQWWETAFLRDVDWQSRWVEPDPRHIDPASDASIMIRREFSVAEAPIAARAYVTSLGGYELHVNGEKVDDTELAPGWTSFRKRLQYQTYDITGLVSPGMNAVGVHLANGWYRSPIGLGNGRRPAGPVRALLAQVHFWYADGSVEVLRSDTSWSACLGPVTTSTLYDGEVWDARLEQPGWCSPGFRPNRVGAQAAGDWRSVVTCPGEAQARLVAQENLPVRVTERIKPNAVFKTPAGDCVLDMGQNMVGRVRFRVKAPAGTRITLRHAEILDNEGNFYTSNLRSAKQLAQYICAGGDTECWAPHFTFMGFRYVHVEGWPMDENAPCGLPLDSFTGEVLHTDMPVAGTFECSHPLVNQLQRNITWGQRGNFVDVPTDCPQRDERLGWTGDAQVFIRTALFNYHGADFFRKWLHDLRADQEANGNVPLTIPDVIGGAPAAGWGDAATICPWTVYLMYGDRQVLAEQYESMRAWVDFVRTQGAEEFLWENERGPSDWLAMDAPSGSWGGATPRDLVSAAFYANSARIVRDAARVLGKSSDHLRYGELHDRIVKRFNEEFITPTGRIASPTQTAHVLALMFDLVDGPVRERVARDLNDRVVESRYHLTTGFLGTPYLCHVLSAHGYHETALNVLLQESFPSWLYSVKKGATTIWEHWDGVKEDGSFWSSEMNSFNHYSLGAVGDWLYRVVAGLDIDEGVPAFKKLVIHPRLSGPRLHAAAARLETPYGSAMSSWRVSNDRVNLEVVIPPNAEAEVVLARADFATVLESDRPVCESSDVRYLGTDEDDVRLQVGSGRYSFTWRVPGLSCLGITAESLYVDAVQVPQVREILKRKAPWVMNAPPFMIAPDRTLRSLVPQILPQPVLNEILEELGSPPIE